MKRIHLVLGAALVLATLAGRAEAQVRVGAFRPSTHAFHFPNAWPSEPIFNINFLGFSIPIGSASNGLCGGMVFAVRDYFQSSYHVPLTGTNPADGSPLFNYLAARLLDSFNGPMGAIEYYTLMSGTDGLRQSTMATEWPRIKADLDAGVLSPMGLIRIVDTDPSHLGINHQVLAYGYDLDFKGNVTLHIYDPNYPLRDDVFIAYTPGFFAGQSTGEHVYSFFRPDYAPATPPPTQTWWNGFEGLDANAWWYANGAGIDSSGFARVGANNGWVRGTTNWNAINTWATVTPHVTCTLGAWIFTGPNPVNGYLSVRDGTTGRLNEVHVTQNSSPSQYQYYTFDFAPDSSTQLFYLGLWGNGSDAWMRLDDAFVSCPLY